MEINSAFNQGVSGFQNASKLINEASVNIASVNVQSKGLSTEGSENNVSITEELINLKVAEFQAVASAKVISTADEMLGTLIDTSI
ncbi:MAG TPA: flagellar biosynthesis protein FlgE [Psychromonas hadalis]|nr:flagellar biosynthesis protein FlgE [Psychromonas hadalis]